MTAAENSLRTDLVRNRRSFAALEADWNDLFARAGKPHNVFQTFAWLNLWAAHYCDDASELAVLLGWSGERLSMAWPLVKRRSPGLSALAWMGDPVSQYGDVLVEPGPQSENWLRAGYERLMEEGIDLFDLRKVRADAAIAPFLAAQSGFATGGAQAPWLDLASAPTFGQFEKRRSGKFRSGLRRHLRRLEETGPVAFEQKRGGPGARDLAQIALAQKRDWARASGIAAPTILDPRFETFFADAALGKGGQSDAVVSIMRHGGDIVAAEISIACGASLFGHVISTRPDYMKRNVGGLLADYVIRTAHARGFEVYDLLAPADSYKLDWADATVDVLSWTLPLTLRGMLWARLVIPYARPALKMLAQQIPKGITRRAVQIYGDHLRAS